MVKHTVFLGSYTSGRGPNPQTNYVSEMIEGFGPSTSEGIYSATFDDANGSLTDLRLAAEVGVSPAWLQWHPSKPVLYSANETFHHGGIRYTLAQLGLVGTARSTSSTHATARFLRIPLAALSLASASRRTTD
jgi:6-phosphogluconolactonase (cycloisomerase 2 family)